MSCVLLCTQNVRDWTLTLTPGPSWVTRMRELALPYQLPKPEDHSWDLPLYTNVSVSLYRTFGVMFVYKVTVCLLALLLVCSAEEVRDMPAYCILHLFIWRAPSSEVPVHNLNIKAPVWKLLTENFSSVGPASSCQNTGHAGRPSLLSAALFSSFLIISSLQSSRNSPFYQRLPAGKHGLPAWPVFLQLEAGFFSKVSHSRCEKTLL